VAMLVVERWNSELGWASSWTLATLCDRLEQCSNLHGTELKRVARRLYRREVVSIDSIDLDRATALLHTLESLGASYSIR
jgi:hypothetical protein